MIPVECFIYKDEKYKYDLSEACLWKTRPFFISNDEVYKVGDTMVVGHPNDIKTKEEAIVITTTIDQIIGFDTKTQTAPTLQETGSLEVEKYKFYLIVNTIENIADNYDCWDEEGRRI